MVMAPLLRLSDLDSRLWLAASDLCWAAGLKCAPLQPDGSLPRQTAAQVALDGFVVAGYIELAEHPSRTWIRAIVVREASRRRGLGRTLVAWALERRTVELAVDCPLEPGAAACQFFRALGFDVDGCLGDRVRFVARRNPLRYRNRNRISQVIG